MVIILIYMPLLDNKKIDFYIIQLSVFFTLSLKWTENIYRFFTRCLEVDQLPPPSMTTTQLNMQESSHFPHIRLFAFVHLCR
jgi:hypothetical protein